MSEPTESGDEPSGHRGDDPVRAGVVGVGHMGENHARVYHHLPEAELCGVADASADRAAAVAADYDTTPLAKEELLERTDVVSVAVPTEYHSETVRQCIEADTDVLVEKPFVDDAETGRSLIELADEHDVTLQVGHVERFNPAVRTLADIVDELDVIAIDADRLSPPVDRDIDDSAVMDLMIHDLDIVNALVDGEVADVHASGARDGRYASATVEFGSGVVGQLTASRVTQEKVRELTITAEDCRVSVDYIDQSIEIRRHSMPEYVREDDSVHFHHESTVEELTVENREPLKHELESFVAAARTDSDPVVTGEDGLAAVSLAQRIDEMVTEDDAEQTPISHS